MKQLTVPIGFAIVAIALWMFGGKSIEALAYQREAILNGQWWRLVTSHWTHLNGKHLLVNLGALLIVWLLFFKSLNIVQWMFSTVLIAIGSTLSLLILNPEVSWYLGLSGLLHGLLVVGALFSIRTSPIVALSVLVFISIKLLTEAIGSSSVSFSPFLGGPVLNIAHIYGAGCGSMVAATLKAIPSMTGRS